MLTTLSIHSTPSIESCAPGRCLEPCNIWASRLCRTSITNVLLPEPETPVTQMSLPSGKRTSIPFRLCSRAQRITRACELPARRLSGTGMPIRPEMYAPVNESGHAIISSSVPEQTTSPPLTPAPGPKSTIQSAARMVSSSCSTTSKVLPRSRIPSRVRSSRA